MYFRGLMRKRPLLLLLLIASVTAVAQDCTELGQNPNTAFPVCGVQVFTQNQVKICGDRRVPGPCDNDEVTDKNPYWYKFTCYTSGTLGFTITPAEITDDYDWQLFDITGKDAKDIYTDKSLFVACNWSGEGGKTGASSEGGSLEICGGLGKPLWSSMPNIVQGHEYLLLISHFTDSQSGYTLEFGGGTGEITDTRIPQMDAAIGSCSGNQIIIKLNKRLRCNSLANDGSDFYLPSGAANITSVSSRQCSQAFDMDSIVIQLDRVLPAAAGYEIGIQRGTDGNTLLDACDIEMPSGVINFNVYKDVSAAFNYELHEGCKKDTVLLTHDGNNDVNEWNWLSDDITASSLQNSSMMYSAEGEKKITLIVSNGYCNDTSSQSVIIQPRLVAAFEAPEIICSKDKAVFADKSLGPIDKWEWSLGDTKTSNQRNPDPFNYSPPAFEQVYKIGLKVSSVSGCADSAFKNVVVVRNCSIAVPTAFTPNNDGKNDFLYPSNAFNADNLIFRVFNRFGQMVFETRDWKRRWDGTFNGKPQGTGTYVWTLSYVLKSTKQQMVFKGTTILIR
jgi:gliding motility-associated-like protein